MFQFPQLIKSKQTVGVQIASGGLSLIVADHSNKLSPKITDYAYYPVASSETVESIIPEVAEFVKDKKLRWSKCCFVLDDKDYQILTIEPPNVPSEEMREAVRWKIKDLVSLPLDEISVDVFLIPSDGNHSKKLANVVVVHKQIIEQITLLIESLELELVAIDIPELCYRNYFVTHGYGDENIALVLLKEDYGKLMVLNRHSVIFSRSFSIQYNAGLLDDLPGHDIALELQRSLDYYERQLKHIVPPKIFVIGENITQDKISHDITESLNQHINAKQLEGFEFTEDQQLSSGRIMAAYGGALRRGMYA